MSRKARLKGKERKQKLEAQKKRESLIGFAIVAVIILIVAAGAWNWLAPSLAGRSGPQGNPTLSTCINEGAIVMHIHAHLQIMISGRPIVIPANVGNAPDCTRPVHTHENDGVIHVESPINYPFTLGDFFAVWGQKFNANTLLSYNADASHKITMTVNGVANLQFENYVLRDGDEIILQYT